METKNEPMAGGLGQLANPPERLCDKEDRETLAARMKAHEKACAPVENKMVKPGEDK